MTPDETRALIDEWRTLDRECTGDARPWPVGDRLTDALEALAAKKRVCP